MPKLRRIAILVIAVTAAVGWRPAYYKARKLWNHSSFSRSAASVSPNTPAQTPAASPRITPRFERYRVGVLPQAFPPELIPAEAPLRDISASVFTDVDGSKEETVSFFTEMPPEALLLYYRRALPGAGWRIERADAVGGTVASRASRQTLYIFISVSSGGSIVSLTNFLERGEVR